jgi:hypothetical protein
LQLDYICRLKSDRAIREALIKPPSSIFQMYDELLLNLVTKNPQDVEDLARILQWLVGSLRPLTLNELAEAISIRDDDQMLDQSGITTDIFDLAALCGSLVSLRSQDTSDSNYEDLYDPYITFITLSHASVEEYLKSGKMDPALQKLFHMDENTIHHEIAKVCIQYVGFDDFKNPITPVWTSRFDQAETFEHWLSYNRILTKVAGKIQSSQTKMPRKKLV